MPPNRLKANIIHLLEYYSYSTEAMLVMFW